MLLVKNEIVHSSTCGARAKCITVKREGYILQHCDAKGNLLPNSSPFLLPVNKIKESAWRKEILTAEKGYSNDT